MAVRLDTPRRPRGPSALPVIVPQRPETLNEPARRIDLQVLALRDRLSPAGSLIAGAGGPVRGDDGSESVFAPHVGVGDRLPQPLGRRFDIDFEHFLHRPVL